MSVKGTVVAMALVAMVASCSASPAFARHRHYHHARHNHVFVRHVEGGRICSERNCATVVAWATGRFQGLVNAFRSMGYAVGPIGCLSAGHMQHSKHHWGGACDFFGQYARNRTRHAPPPHVQIETARAHGLVSGCVWRNPDCGHFEVAARSP